MVLTPTTVAYVAALNTCVNPDVVKPVKVLLEVFPNLTLKSVTLLADP